VDKRFAGKLIRTLGRMDRSLAKSREVLFSECGIWRTEPRCRLDDFGKRFGHWIESRNQAPSESVAPT